MEYLCIGKLVNTHGIKGEVRIISNFRHKNKIFIKGFKFYIGKEKKEYELETYRVHKKFDMVVFKDNYDINLVECLKGSLVYVNKNEIKQDSGEILAINLIGYDLLIEDKSIGIVEDVIDNGATEILVTEDNIMIPYVESFIKNIDKEKRIIEINNIKGLID